MSPPSTPRSPRARGVRRFASEDRFGDDDVAASESFGTIVVATDLAPPAHAAVEHAIQLAQDLRARLVLVYVLHVDAMFPGPEATQALLPVRLAALVALQHVLDRVRERHADSAMVFAEGIPAEEIVAAAQRASADLLVMGTHARRGLARLWQGSIAETVARTSPIPVLVVPRSESD